MSRFCVYCGSNPGTDPAFVDLARSLGDALLERGHGLVYGGGSVGLMGVVAERVHPGGGEVVGVIPEVLLGREVGYSELPDLRVCKTMHERKALMAELADGFIALPGGIGTIEEIIEVMTWAQLGIHRKPVALLDVRGYWSSFTGFLDHACKEGFIREENRAILLHDDDPRRLLDRFNTFEPPDVVPW